MLIIAISHGSLTDPFTTSVQTRADFCTPEPVDGNDRQACLAYICKEKNLKPEWVDALLIVELPDYDAEPEVTHNYTEF